MSPSFIPLISFFVKSNKIGIVQGVSSTSLLSTRTFSRSFLHKNPVKGEKTPFEMFNTSSERFVFISNFGRSFIPDSYFFMYRSINFPPCGLGICFHLNLDIQVLLIYFLLFLRLLY